MKVEVISPNKRIFEGESQIVTLPGTKGSFQVLDNHAPLISTLSKGKLGIGNDKTFNISGGVAEVLGNKITVLVTGVE